MLEKSHGYEEDVLEVREALGGEDGMILAVVGSTSIPAHPKVIEFLTGTLKRYNPDGFVSGGAEGVDTIAEKLFRELYPDRPTYIFYPMVFNWNHHRGFKWRNKQIAEKCHMLVRVAHAESKTYGSGWTADYAQQLGKRVERYRIDSKWEFARDVR